MSTTTISTPLPAGVTPEQVIKALQNHELMLKMVSPTLISHELESGDPSGTATYSVTDKRPIGQATYKVTFKTVPEGLDTQIDAKPPTGQLKIDSRWRVVNGELREEVDIDGNMVTKKMAKGNIEKQHPEQHQALLEAAKA